MVSRKLLLERCQSFGDMILPFDEDEKKSHCLFVLICVLGVLKLQPKLFTSSFINLAQHLLDNLLVSRELFREKLVSYIIDSGCRILSITLWLFILLCWCLSFELIIGWDWYDTGVLLKEHTKINVVVLNMIIVPKCGEETSCPWLPDVRMNGKYLLANVKRHYFVLLDYV